MPRAGLNGWRLRRQTGGIVFLFQRVARQPCAARRREPCNLPRSVLTQWVKAVSCEILIEIRKLQARMSGPQVAVNNSLKPVGENCIKNARANRSAAVDDKVIDAPTFALKTAIRAEPKAQARVLLIVQRAEV